MYRPRVGKSISFGEDFSSRMSEAESAGLDAFDFDLCAHWREREKEIALYGRLEDGLQRIEQSPLLLNGVHISFGPVWEFSAVYERSRASAVRLAEEIFARVDPAGPGCYILHGSWEPIADGERPRRLEQLKRSLRELRERTAARICVESLPRTCLGNTSRELKDIADGVDGIDVCLDCNHFLREKPEDAVAVLGSRIRTTHISDYDFVDERHWLPGTGKIDWNAFIGALEKAGYDGVFNYEVKVPAREIKENFEQLFAAYNGRQRS